MLIGWRKEGTSLAAQVEKAKVNQIPLAEWIKPHMGSLLLGLLCIVVVVVVDVSLPFFFGDILVDGVLISGDDMELLHKITLGGVLLFFIKGIFVYGQVYLMSYVGQKVVYDLRTRLYRQLLHMPLGQHIRHKSGSLVARMTSDIGVIQSAVTAGLTDLILHSLSLFLIIVMLFVLNWRLALVSMIILPIASGAIRGYGGRIRKFTGRLQERIAGMTATLQESLEGIRVIKAFRMEGERQERFQKDNEMSFGASMKSVQAMATVTPVVELILIAGMLIVLWFGGRSVLREEMTPGGLVAFLGYLAMSTRPIGFLTKSFNLLQQATSAAQRITDLMQTPKEETAHESVRLDEVQGRVTFEKVTFGYSPGAPVLKEITFEALPGETIALVGASGAGKSTLVNLIPRFYAPDSGRILIDGVDIQHLDLNALRGLIGLVPQETLLFGMSIAENIAAGRKEIGPAEIRRAAELANAHDFISKLPDGYDTIVGERGATLSGGQRQRIAIARAVAGDPRILILDEATSALDAESEAIVRDAILRVKADRTTFVIAHRLSTVIGASKIIVLENGCIAEMGTHRELLQRGRIYPSLYQKQFGAEVPSTGTELAAQEA